MRDGAGMLRTVNVLGSSNASGGPFEQKSRAPRTFGEGGFEEEDMDDDAEGMRRDGSRRGGSNDRDRWDDSRDKERTGRRAPPPRSSRPPPPRGARGARSGRDLMAQGKRDEGTAVRRQFAPPPSRDDRRNDRHDDRHDDRRNDHDYDGRAGRFGDRDDRDYSRRTGGRGGRDGRRYEDDAPFRSDEEDDRADMGEQRQYGARRRGSGSSRAPVEQRRRYYGSDDDEPEIVEEHSGNTFREGRRGSRDGGGRGDGSRSGTARRGGFGSDEDDDATHDGRGRAPQRQRPEATSAPDRAAKRRRGGAPRFQRGEDIEVLEERGERSAPATEPHRAEGSPVRPRAVPAQQEPAAQALRPTLSDPSESKCDTEDDAAPAAVLAAEALATLQESLKSSKIGEFLSKPVAPELGTLQCKIVRIGATKMSNPGYQLFLDDVLDKKQGSKFLMFAKKCAKNKTSNYHITSEDGNASKESDGYLGKLRSNFLGTEFIVYDNGINPKDARNPFKSGKKSVRKELGVVCYEKNVMGTKGPRRMHAAVPAISEDGTARTFRESKHDNIVEKFKRDCADEGLVELVNKPPRWDERIGEHVLNFHGRVTRASVKNFQLVKEDDHKDVLLQFGRVEKDVFTMDFQHPYSPIQAFAFALSSFDSKMACE